MPHVELPQAEFKVVMLGDTNTGKTSLVLRFAEGYYRQEARSSTVGAFFITKRLQVQGITCKIQIWDTAGQEQFKCMAPMYYRNAAAAIVCYDVTSPSSYQTMRFWVDELHRNIPAGSIVICIAATKTDLSPKVDLAQAEQMANAMGAMFVETSAKTNTNVVELYRKVAERVLQFKQNMPIPVTPGARIDESGKLLKRSQPRVEVNAPKRRDKRTKDDQLLLETSSSDVVENKMNTGVMCMGDNSFLCGQQHDVVSSCILL
jgi:small GTP-binding protein